MSESEPSDVPLPRGSRAMLDSVETGPYATHAAYPRLHPVSPGRILPRDVSEIPLPPAGPEERLPPAPEEDPDYLARLRAAELAGIEARRRRVSEALAAFQRRVRIRRAT